MEESLSDVSYSLNSIQRIFKSDLILNSSQQEPTALLDFEDYHSTASFQDHGCRYKYYTSQERQSLIDSKCGDFYDATANIDDQSQRLDDVFSALFNCQWRPKKLTSEEIVRDAQQLFSRMPSVPLKLPDPLGALPPAHFIGSEKSWDSLKVVRFPCQNLIRFVLHGIISTPVGYQTNVQIRALNGVAEIINKVTLKSASATAEAERQRWFSVRAFLWSFWQRARTLSIYFTFRSTIRWGQAHNGDTFHWVRNFFVSPGISMLKLSERAAEEGKGANMCSWAFRLLRTDSAAVGLAFPLFHKRFSAVFGGEPSRCRANSDLACDGNHYNQCLRFVGAHVEDQSAHDSNCKYDSDTEAKLKWDEASYNATDGSRAVSIEDSDLQTGRLRYRTASDRTLAISHVWSHGQGGRPEVGINSCLHMRYSRLARDFGCDTYWMDTTCIPTAHRLRREAIGYINSTFHSCRAVLICDKDLMKIDVTNMSIELQESLLVASLMCDWNIRAWTVLEATKGREKIFILCKDNKTIDFCKLVGDVYQHGSITVAVFSIFLPHMFPWETEETRSLRPTLDGYISDMSLWVAGTWLSHRPASRPGDDLVIWSLLFGSGKQHYNSAIEFWKALVGTTIPTGYLVSSAPRLASSGLSWAPKSPFVAPGRPMRRRHTQFADFIRPTIGTDTEFATIRNDGLYGEWLVYKFESRLGLWVKNFKKPRLYLSSRYSLIPLLMDQELDTIRRRFLPCCDHGALLRPASNALYSSDDRATEVRDLTEQGTTVVVCGSNDGDWNSEEWMVCWKWKGLYNWPANVELPTFERDRQFWIG